MAQPMPMPHRVCPMAQTHCPDTHVPEPQLWLQVPQWAGSLLVS